MIRSNSRDDRDGGGATQGMLRGVRHRVSFAFGHAPSPKHVFMVSLATVAMLLGYLALIAFPLIYGRSGLLSAFLFGVVLILPSGWWFWHVNRRKRMALDVDTYTETTDRKWRFVAPTAALAFIAGCFSLTGLERLGPVDPPKALDKIDGIAAGQNSAKTDSSNPPSSSFNLQATSPNVDSRIFDVPEATQSAEPSTPVLSADGDTSMNPGSIPVFEDPAPTPPDELEPPIQQPQATPEPPIDDVGDTQTQTPSNPGTPPSPPSQPAESPDPDASVTTDTDGVFEGTDEPISNPAAQPAASNEVTRNAADEAVIGSEVSTSPSAEAARLN